jgi:predicted nucleic acid-binding protein
VILADTSIWIDHLRGGNLQLRQLLSQGQVVVHPLIVGELALGSFKQRSQVLALLDLLPQIQAAQLNEVRHMIGVRRLNGRGIGLLDAHLIASVLIDSSTRLWTRDKNLRRVAEDLHIHAGLA